MWYLQDSISERLTLLKPEFQWIGHRPIQSSSSVVPECVYVSAPPLIMIDYAHIVRDLVFCHKTDSKDIFFFVDFKSQRTLKSRLRSAA